MPIAVSDWRRRLTLAGCTLLHAFTHAYATALVPLYILVARDLGLGGVGWVTLIVAAYVLVYSWGGYPAGVLADRLDRRWLLVIGLLGNALAILAMGFTHAYWLLLSLGIVAGLFGTLFHPAAISLCAAHYPRHPGMAVGIMGAGAGLGFFFGPQFAGWRAQTGNWTLAGMSAWQRPLIEMGLLGILGGLIFLLMAAESPARRQRIAQRNGTAEDRHEPLGGSLRKKILLLAAVLGWRDFVGAAQPSLASIYLQKAGHLDVKQTGLLLGAMMLLGVIVNPLSVWLTPGRRRLPGLAIVLGASGLVVLTTPFWPVAWVLVALCAFQSLHLSSFAMTDAAVLERISPAVRGRFVGMYLACVGTITSFAPSLMGFWTDGMGRRAHESAAYYVPFAVLAAMMLASCFGVPLLGLLGPRQAVVQPVEEIEPRIVPPLA